MSSEKRLLLCVTLTFASVLGIQYAMVRMGWLPAEKARPAAVAKGNPVDPIKANVAETKAKPELPDNVFLEEKPDLPVVPVAKPGPKLARADQLVIGSSDDDADSAYHLKLQLDQFGATVRTGTSARYDAELDPNDRNKPVKRLELITTDPKSKAPGSLAITLAHDVKKGLDEAPKDDNETPLETTSVEIPLDLRTWEIVRESENAPAVRSISKVDGKTQAKVDGQEIAFRLAVDELSVVVTKTFRIYQGEDGFDISLNFKPTGKETKFVYHLIAPHGIPIEGEWYTSTFRDIFFDQVGSSKVTTRPASDVIKYRNDPTQRFTTLPLKFAGVEDQYFTTLIEPDPIPEDPEKRIDDETGAVIILENVAAPQKSNVGVEIVSRPILLGLNREVTHKYKVFAGPKTYAALLPYKADDLSSYRKWQLISIPYAGTLARNVIAPLLDRIYALTESVARMLGWSKGNYGIAIILLTMTVRLIMFPLGRKQAMMAKKMQDLQPILAEVKEKYKDDKEALTRETMAVWKRHKVNPAAGCLPALIQMPIFVGLWQTLNNSVALRHSTFLYIRDLAAPDMLFKFPFEIPFVGSYLGNYFNLLPFLVVSLMLVQTKLFAPPPTTPEAEMNQKMMKYMMIVMAFMFYKVPSGLGLYFITSSTWQICERLLLPKVIAKNAKPITDDNLPGDKGFGEGRGSGGSGRGPGGNGNGNGGGGVQGWLSKRLEKLMEDAAKTKTIRNDERPSDRPVERVADRDRPRPRPKPGKRR